MYAHYQVVPSPQFGDRGSQLCWGQAFHSHILKLPNSVYFVAVCTYCNSQFQSINNYISFYRFIFTTRVL